MRVQLALGSIAGAAWLPYSPILNAFFRHDDFVWLAAAQRWAAGTQPLLQGQGGVTVGWNLVLAALYNHWGLEPRPYFAVVLGFHVLCSLLVFALALAVTRRLGPSWVAGMLFAILPVHHEAVTWPAGALHILAAAPLLVAAIAWLAYRRGNRAALPVALAVGAVALFTKDSAVALWPLLAVVDWGVFPARSRRALLWLGLPYVALAAWRTLYPPLLEPIPVDSAAYRPGPHMLSNLVLVPPQILIPDLRFENYQAMLSRVLPGPTVHIALGASVAAILCASVLALIGLVKGPRMVKVGIAWLYLGFLPMLPFSYEYARAPRYGYIPSIGLAFLAAPLIDWAARRHWRRSATVAAAVVFALVSVGFLRMVCANRLRDSVVRREVIAAVRAAVPSPTPDTRFVLSGLPPYLDDLWRAIPVYYYPVPVRATVAEAPPDAGYQLRFDPAQPGRLLECRRIKP